MKSDIERAERAVERHQRAFKFWSGLSRVTRFGLHGLVIWLAMRAFEKTNAAARELNRIHHTEGLRRKQEMREMRRARAIQRKGAR